MTLWQTLQEPLQAHVLNDNFFKFYANIKPVVVNAILEPKMLGLSEYVF